MADMHVTFKLWRCIDCLSPVDDESNFRVIRLSAALSLPLILYKSILWFLKALNNNTYNLICLNFYHCRIE